MRAGWERGCGWVGRMRAASTPSALFLCEPVAAGGARVTSPARPHPSLPNCRTLSAVTVRRTESSLKRLQARKEGVGAGDKAAAAAAMMSDADKIISQLFLDCQEYGRQLVRRPDA